MKKSGFWKIRNCNLFIPRPQWRMSKPPEKPPTVKREHPVLQNMKSLHFLCFLWVTLQRSLGTSLFRKNRVPDPDPHGSALIWLSWIWIRIRIGYADPDPGTRKLTKNQQINLISSLSKWLLYLLRYVLWHITYSKYTFNVKSNFCNVKAWLGSGSGLVWLPEFG